MKDRRLLVVKDRRLLVVKDRRLLVVKDRCTICDLIHSFERESVIHVFHCIIANMNPIAANSKKYIVKWNNVVYYESL